METSTKNWQRGNALQTCVLQYVIYNRKTTKSQICWNVGNRNVSKKFVPVTCYFFTSLIKIVINLQILG